MIVKCISNSGEYLREYELQPLLKQQMGRFGSTGFTEYGELEIGREYLVMGIIIFEAYQAFLIDSNGFISASPCQLFEIINNEIDSNWQFRLVGKDENIYPFIQAMFGYQELISDKFAYEKLIVDRDEQAQRLYFRRRIEIENKAKY